MDPGNIDLSCYSDISACYWLLDKLGLASSTTTYAQAYTNYVLTWPKAVPLTCIIIMQSPYNRNIYPDTAAAMSFDDELCQKEYSYPVPPSVHILANDLRLHSNKTTKDYINVFRHGSCLVEKGILLINQSVLAPTDSALAYREGLDQLRVVLGYCKRVRDTVSM